MSNTGYVPYLLYSSDGSVLISGGAAVDLRVSGGGVGSNLGAPLFFAGDPSSVRVAAGVAVGWDDIRGPAYPSFTAVGGPPIDASGGIGPFSNTQWLQTSTAIPSDADIFTLLVSRQISSVGGGIVEMSDSLLSNRSVMIVNDAGFRAAKYAGLDTSFFAYAGAQPRTLERIMSGYFARGFYVNGVYATDTNERAIAIRSPNLVRLGNYVQGGAGAAVVIDAIRIYLATPLDEQIDSLESGLTTVWSLPAPPTIWPPAAASVSTGDPRFVLPPFVDAAAGEDIEIWKESVRYRDGFTATNLIASDLTPDPLAPPDRWRFRAPPVGEHSVTWEESGYFGQTTLRVTPRTAGVGLGTVNVVCVGDSITQAGSWVWRLHDLMVNKLAMIGSLTIDGIKQEGRSGWTYALFNSIGSPFFNGGAVLDWPGYVAAQGTPKIVYFVLGTNDWNSTDANIEAAITASFVDLDAQIAAIHGVDPTIAVAVVTPFTGNGNSAAWGGAANRYQFLRCMNRGVRRTLDTYGGREAQEIYVVWPFGQIDSQRGFRYDSGVGDTLHPNRIVGDREIARAIYGWTNWYVQRKGL